LSRFVRAWRPVEHDWPIQAAARTVENRS
jgi:hypothetical protein